MSLFSLFRRPAPAATARAARPSRPQPVRARSPEDLRSPPAESERSLTRKAQEWVSALPPGLHPAQMCAMYPRLVNRLSMCWSDPVLTQRVFDDLLLDRRGGRRGFSPQVAAELLRLRQLHLKRPVPEEESEDGWDMRMQAVCDRG